MKPLIKSGGIQTRLCELISLKPLRILCAEDNSQVALLLRYTLESAGHKVECAKDGQQALELMEPDVNAFQLLVTDHEMPRMSGLRLVARLREIAFSGKIVVHSSPLCDRDAQAYRGFGIDHILSKPADPGRILALVQEIGNSAT